MKRASFFDIDGTLYKGLIIHEFPRYLASRGIFRKECFDGIDAHVQRYRDNEESYREIGLAIPKLYASGLKGKKVDVVKEEARNFIEMYKANMFSYTTGLIELMNDYGLTIAISGSPIEVIGFLKNIHEFDLVYATELKVKDGVYTGEVEKNLIIRETKKSEFKRIVRDKKIDLSISFGFGDTEQDLSFLSIVGNPVVLNPNQELSSIAQKNGWMVLHSGDNIINVINKKLIEIKSE